MRHIKSGGRIGLPPFVAFSSEADTESYFSRLYRAQRRVAERRLVALVRREALTHFADGSLRHRAAERRWAIDGRPIIGPQA